MADTVHLSLDDAHALALGALTASSFSDDQARAVADTVIAAERDECTSHGLFRIPFHVKALQNTDVNTRAVPELADRAPRVLHVDAEFGFAPLAL
jgi:delta1-piperideine-2-carboxylate reductase